MKMKAMMTKIFMWLFVGNFAYVQSAPKLIESKNLKSVDVNYVYLRTTTPINVDCTSFLTSFDEIKSKRLATESEWFELIEVINHLIQNGELVDESPDVRMRMVLQFKDGSSRVICVGNNLTSLDGITLATDEDFRNFILSHFSE
jgi:hypothetical protein